MANDIPMAKWMRIALLLTGALNMFGAALFLPALSSLRESNGFPAESHPLYLSIISSWIFLFGVCYLWLGVRGKDERLFLVIGAAGKLAFVILLLAYAATGDVPFFTAVSSLPDFVFAAIFAYWLWTTRDRRLPGI